ncbi:MAG: neuraminidase-like domain-containing protein [Ferruginibacter sp.]
MQPIIPPLKSGQQDDKVANLNKALLFLLGSGSIKIEVSPTHTTPDFASAVKQNISLFGDGTLALIRIFQQQYLIPVSGQVDQPTADKLNRLIKEQAGFDYLVTGKITYKDGTPLANAVVVARDKDHEVVFGKSATGADGHYSIEYDATKILTPPKSFMDLVVYVLNADGTMLAASVVIPSPSYSEVLDINIIELLFMVSGQVLTAAGTPALNMQVNAVDKGIGGRETLLGIAVIDGNGNYSIGYKETQLAAVGKKTADLEISVTDPNIPAAPKIIIGLIADARQSVIMNGTIPYEASMAAQPSEFQQLHAEIGKFVPVEQLHLLKDTPVQPDITLLTQKTGWDKKLVSMASGAAQQSQSTAIKPELYYALYRAGVSTDPQVVYGYHPNNVQTILTKAAENNIIPKDNIDASVAEFKTKRFDFLLNQKAERSVSSLNDLVAVTGLSEDNQKKFAGLYIDHDGDTDSFWEKATEAVGDEVNNLKLVGKLAFLTSDNAPLIKKLTGGLASTDPVDLVRNGFYKPEKWTSVLDESITVPQSIEGQDRGKYAEVMSAQLKISYPTAVVAEMVKAEELPLKNPAVKDKVYQFFNATQGKFELGQNQLDDFKNDVADIDTAKEIMRLQRTFQMSPSDDAMKVLLTNDLDSAYKILQHEQEDFIAKVKDGVGGEEQAKNMYAKAAQIHSTVMNLATSFLASRNSPPVYAITGAKKSPVAAPLRDTDEPGVADHAEAGGNGAGVSPTARSAAGGVEAPDHKEGADKKDIPAARAEAGALIKYAKLEELFGALDYPDCDYCHSIFSPPAYLADHLHFLDYLPESLKQAIPAPAKPLDVLLARRPDIQHIDLTCENAMTVLPYIDIVNEILEYYIINKNLKDFKSFNVTTETTQELLANPQHVELEVYDNILSKMIYPMGLPFNLALESLRTWYSALGISLPAAMETLLKKADLEGVAGSFGLRSVLIEYAGISQVEYDEVYTGNKKIPAYYGKEEDMPFTDFQAFIDNAKNFSRSTGLSYDELTRLLETKFINSSGILLSRLEKLASGDGKTTGIDLVVIHEYFKGSLTDTELEAKIPPGIDAGLYGGDIKKWIKDQHDRIMSLILWVKPADEPDTTGFDKLVLRYAEPADDDYKKLKETEYLRIYRFIRFWKNCGISIEETDRVITALWPVEQLILNTDDENGVKGKLNEGFKILLLKWSFVNKIRQELKLTGENTLVPLLTLWADIDVYGESSLYSQLFLSPAINRIDAVFQPDPVGEYLSAATKISAHLPVLQAVFKIRGDELQMILEKNILLDKDLTIATLSDIYRHAFLPAALRTSVLEFLIVKKFSLFSPFTLYDSEKFLSPTLAFIEELRLVKKPPVQLLQLDYILAHEDSSGINAVDKTFITSQALIIKSGLNSIELEFAIQDDPTLELAKSRMMKLFDPSSVDTFFGLLSSTVSFEKKDYIIDALPANFNNQDKLVYVHDQKKLVHSGIISDAERDALLLLAGGDAGLKAAITELYTTSNNSWSTLPVQFKTYYDAVTAPGPNIREAINNIWADTKRQQQEGYVLQYFSGSLKASLVLLQVLVQKPGLLVPSKASFADLLSEIINLLNQTDETLSGETITRFSEIYLRLAKAVRLAEVLNLSVNELLYFAQYIKIANHSFLNVLPVEIPGDSSNSQVLFDAIHTIASYNALKDVWSIKDDSLVQTFLQFTGGAGGDAGILQLVKNWNKTSCAILLDHYGIVLNKDEPGSLVKDLYKLTKAFDLLALSGFSAAQVIKWTTPEPTLSLIEEMKSVLRSRYDEPAWLILLQDINDPLRDSRRDGLVAYILTTIMPADPVTANIDTADKMFEYFLIDVQMDACMKTSRIKQAILTVQLFVSRCLINLEQEVSPAAIRTDWWTWMKNENVWESNRRVFTYPENWLEPAFRTIKSSFFKDLEGELLQADITEEGAQVALLNYLEKLDEVATMQIVAMHLDERDSANKEDHILHVFGRSSRGLAHKYYYRRFENHSYWTPWEKIDQDIEGEPLLPVIWKNRLFLTWFNIVQKGAEGTVPSKPNPKDWTDLTSKVNVELNLCWSEYYNGRWQPKKTSDVNDPWVFIKNGENKPFNRNSLISNSQYKFFCFVGKEHELNLVKNNSFHISTKADGLEGFKLYNKQNAAYTGSITFDVQPGMEARNMSLSNNKVSVSVKLPGQSYTHNVITNIYMPVLTDNKGLLLNAYEAPFFMSDLRHAFFIIPNKTGIVTIKEYHEFSAGNGQLKRAGIDHDMALAVVANSAKTPENSITAKPAFQRKLFE